MSHPVGNVLFCMVQHPIIIIYCPYLSAGLLRSKQTRLDRFTHAGDSIAMREKHAVSI